MAPALKKQLLPVVLVLILLIALPVALILVRQTQLFKKRAAGQPSIPQKVQVSNVFGNGFTVSWTNSPGDAATEALVIFGTDMNAVSTALAYNYNGSPPTSQNGVYYGIDDRLNWDSGWTDPAADGHQFTTHHLTLQPCSQSHPDYTTCQTNNPGLETILTAGNTIYYKLQVGNQLYGLVPGTTDDWAAGGAPTSQRLGADLTFTDTNLVQNPSFENDLTNWTVQGGQVDTTHFTDGTKSLKLNGNAAAFQAVNIAPNTLYTLFAQVKVESGTAVVTSNPQSPGTSQLQFNQNDFQGKILYLKPNGNSLDLTLSLLNNTGTAYFDNLQFYQGRAYPDVSYGYLVDNQDLVDDTFVPEDQRVVDSLVYLQVNQASELSASLSTVVKNAEGFVIDPANSRSQDNNSWFYYDIDNAQFSLRVERQDTSTSQTFAAATTHQPGGANINVLGGQQQPTATPTTPPNQSTIRFKVKFDRLASNAPDPLNVKATIKNSSSVVEETIASLPVNYAVPPGNCDTDRTVYCGTVTTSVQAGTHKLFVKGPAHLQRYLGDFILNDVGEAFSCPQQTSRCPNWDVQNKPLLGGDADLQNGVDLSNDFVYWRLDYLDATRTPPTAPSRNADFNFDNTVDLSNDFIIWRSTYLLPDNGNQDEQ